MSQRFDGETKESPDFQRHVLPLLGRLGCNGRACHGSFQGQGGFRLSLFGYDFAQDHQALVKRLDRQAAEDSLLLLKPTAQVAHKGGKRFEKDGWTFRLLKRWIETGAKNTSGHRLLRLEVTPPEVVLKKPGDRAAVRAIAHWDDGIQEDVTCLCRFQTNDDAVAEVDADGNIKIVGRGDTHVVAFYDSGVTAVPVLVPIREASNYPEGPRPTKIDELVIARLRKLGIVPSELCSDTEFLRRVSIDLTGTLPTPDEVVKFLADAGADKRARKIDELLDSPAYAALWANRLGDFTGNSRFGQAEGANGQLLAVQWYAWLYRRIADNMPYDKLVEGIVLATSRRQGQNYDDYAAEMSACFREKEPADFSRREALPYYWLRRSVAKPEEKALAFAHSFLGLRLQCAQCHKHPFDRWSLHDFQQFAAFFAPLQYGVAPESRAAFDKLAASFGVKGKNDNAVTQELFPLAIDGKTVPFRELYVANVPTGKNLQLLGNQVALRPQEDPRAALMSWLRQPDNPYFARAFVNRVWANYFHAGLIEPVDDLNPANPPSNPELLDYLTEDFVSNNYDMKRLHRLIVSSNTYQRSWRPNDTNRDDRRHFSRAVPRRLSAEVVYDALTQVTAANSELVNVRLNLERRAIGHLSTHLTSTYAMHVFGKPDRIMSCDCERTNTTSLLQAIFLQNDPLLHQRVQDSSWLKEVAAAKEFDAVDMIRQAYLRTIGRLPTESELARARRHIDESASKVEGLRDVLWALINTKEFVLNH